VSSQDLGATSDQPLFPYVIQPFQKSYTILIPFEDAGLFFALGGPFTFTYVRSIFFLPAPVFFPPGFFAFHPPPVPGPPYAVSFFSQADLHRAAGGFSHSSKSLSFGVVEPSGTGLHPFT